MFGGLVSGRTFQLVGVVFGQVCDDGALEERVADGGVELAASDDAFVFIVVGDVSGKRPVHGFHQLARRQQRFRLKPSR